MRFIAVMIYLLLGGWSYGQEEILQYQVDIDIQENSKIEVTETITVRAEGQQIRRGIFRIIPTIRPDESGRNEPAPIEILSVQRDGQQEEYHTERSRNSITLYLGQESVILSPGVYTYELKYLASNQIGFFEEYDELYWNVIGPDWSFPIQDYSVTLHLPGEAEYLQGACYTGRPGSRSSDCMISAGAVSGQVVSRSDKGLRPGEGFTVAVAWPKGFVDAENAGAYNLQGKNFLLYIVGLLIFVFFGYDRWKKVGQDPPGQAVVPDWHPPANYSPAQISYLHNRQVTNTALSAALVSAAIKGVIRIENKKKKFTFHRNGDSGQLTPEESALVDGLVPMEEFPFELKRSTYKSFERAKSSFTGSLKRNLNIRDYFKPNLRQAAAGSLLLALLTAIALGVGLYPLIDNRILAMGLVFVILVILILLLSIPFYIFKWYKWLIIIPVWVGLTAFFTVFYTTNIFFTEQYVLIAIIAGFTIILAAWYNYLIYAPTVKGQQTKAEIQGFRMYLDKSEKAMLDYFTPPEKTPELFEKLLPFAIALGVENRWGKKFKSVLDAAIEQGTYSPLWYTGNIHQINTLHSNFQSAVSHAAPKSSSGSGGGGFSGGGGGGGGGGGW